MGIINDIFERDNFMEKHPGVRAPVHSARTKLPRPWAASKRAVQSGLGSPDGIGAGGSSARTSSCSFQRRRRLREGLAAYVDKRSRRDVHCEMTTTTKTQIKPASF